MVYLIHLSCGIVYTGQCFNDCAWRHRNDVKNGYGNDLVDHCKKCACFSLFKRTNFIGKGKTKKEREIIEAFYIRIEGDNCVSAPSSSATGKRDKLSEGKIMIVHGNLYDVHMCTLALCNWAVFL